MVDSALFQQVLQLDADSRREFIRAVEGTLAQEETPVHVIAEIDRRVAKLGSDPDPSAMTLDEFERRLVARRGA